MLSLNPYAYCSFRCVYCSVEAQGRSRPARSPEEVLRVVRHRLGELAPGDVIALGALGDAYPPIEEGLQLTRRVLELLLEAKARFGIVTKSPLVCRDADLLRDQPLCVGVTLSVSTHVQADVIRLEPGAPSYEARRNAAFELREASVPTRVNVAPWIPGLTDTERLIRDFAPAIPVFFGALDFGESQGPARTFFGLPEETPAGRFLGSEVSQRDVNRAYLLEARRFMNVPGTHWLVPPGMTPSDHVLRAMFPSCVEELLALLDADPPGAVDRAHAAAVAWRAARLGRVAQ
jgi:hypothetical protein